MSYFNLDCNCNANIKKSLRILYIIEEEKVETASRLDQYLEKSFPVIEKIERTLQSLHLDVIATQQKHEVELAQLEQ